MFGEDELFVCSGCGAEPGEALATQKQLELEGWDFGEYGAQCPECADKAQPGSGTQGLDAVVAALGTTKKE
jgi:hypothetical protein